MKKPRDRSTDSPTFDLKSFDAERQAVDPQIEYTAFTEAHLWGARVVLHKLMSESRHDWTSTAFRLWAEKELIELERLEDDIR